MSDSYQAIYDAVRSRIHGGNISDAIQSVARDALDISHAKAMLQQEIASVGYEMTRPSVVFRPSIAADGTMWSVLLGSNIQEGVCGFGATPEEAMADFDRNFRKGQTPEARRLSRPAPGGSDER